MMSIEIAPRTAPLSELMPTTKIAIAPPRATSPRATSSQLIPPRDCIASAMIFKDIAIAKIEIATFGASLGNKFTVAVNAAISNSIAIKPRVLCSGSMLPSATTESEIILSAMPRTTIAAAVAKSFLESPRAFMANVKPRSIAKMPRRASKPCAISAGFNLANVVKDLVMIAIAAANNSIPIVAFKLTLSNLANCMNKYNVPNTLTSPIIPVLSCSGLSEAILFSASQRILTAIATTIILTAPRIAFDFVLVSTTFIAAISAMRMPITPTAAYIWSIGRLPIFFIANERMNIAIAKLSNSLTIRLRARSLKRPPFPSNFPVILISIAIVPINSPNIIPRATRLSAILSVSTIDKTNNAPASNATAIAMFRIAFALIWFWKALRVFATSPRTLGICLKESIKVTKFSLTSLRNLWIVRTKPRSVAELNMAMMLLK